MCLYVTNPLTEAVPMLWVNGVPSPFDERLGLRAPPEV